MYRTERKSRSDYSKWEMKRRETKNRKCREDANKKEKDRRQKSFSLTWSSLTSLSSLRMLAIIMQRDTGVKIVYVIFAPFSFCITEALKSLKNEIQKINKLIPVNRI